MPVQPSYVTSLRYRYVDDLDVLLWLLFVHLRVFDLVYYIHPCSRSTEYRVLVVEPRLVVVKK
jgi:hypothetical protein